jgi:hypothetical protein
MTAPVRHVGQAVLAVAAAAGAVLSWAQVRSLVDVAPVTEGQPATVSVFYDPPMMVLTLVLELEERIDNISTNIDHHFQEHFIAFLFVFNQRIFLTITAQTHRLTQALHRL